MSEKDLCEDCQKDLYGHRGNRFFNLDHCHHTKEKKEPCSYCKPGAVIAVTKKAFGIPFNYCPNCGRGVKDE